MRLRIATILAWLTGFLILAASAFFAVVHNV
jgi:hypothetical protein